MAIGSRLRGIIDELIATGYPDQVAERIAKGDLDMRTDAIVERQQDMFPTTAFHGGGDDIRVVDPNRITSGKTANTGFFMSDSPVVAASYADRVGNIMPLAVDTRGFDLVDAGGSYWNQIVNPEYYLGGTRRATVADIPNYRGTRTPDQGLFDVDPIGEFDTDDIARVARDFGSPGLILRDIRDVGPNYKAFDPAFEAMTGLKLGDEGYQEALDRFSADTIVASDPTRVRSLFAAFDPEYKGSNILGGAATAAVGAGLLAAPEEAEAGPVKTAKDLLFLHNTTADKLARQSAMGGMPNPSIAVTQQDVPFTGFGDISLVGKPEAFDPKLRSNPLYSADAYTVRAPSPVRVANKGAYKQFSSDFASYRDAGNIDDVAYSLADLETKTRLEPSDFRRVNDFLEYDNAAALKFADDVGIKMSNKDYHEISQMKRDNADKYREWKDGVLDQYFQREEFFVTNPDFDRYAGRANLKPYTADNVSRYMTRQAGANKESTMTFGAGNIRASTAERISSLPKAREMKGLLQPADAVAEVKETASMMLGDLQTALRDYYKYDTSSFRYFDEVGEMIALSERKGMKRAMEEIGFENVPDSLIKEIDEYKDYLRSAPTEYFESKPQRAVQLTDFAGAIVPKNTSQGVLDMLSRAGLKVEKYGDEATRTEARKRFQDYMFDAAPTIGGGVGLGLLGMPQESVADTAARLRAESDTSGAYAPRSGLLQDVTMAARDLERRLEGSPASLLFPSGYVQHLEEFNRPYERSTYTGALLGALDFL